MFFHGTRKLDLRVSILYILDSYYAIKVLPVDNSLLRESLGLTMLKFYYLKEFYY